MVPAQPPAPRPVRQRRGLLPAPELTLPGDLALPFRQELRVPVGDWGTLTPHIAATLEAAGYRVVGSARPRRSKRPPLSPPSASVTVGERNRHPIRMLRPMRASIWALFAGGLVLGAFDTIAVGNPLVLIPWVLVAAGIAALFWYRWGRSYESDVVAVTWHAGRGGEEGGVPAASAVPRLVWWAGRVRSDIRGASRTAVAAEYVTSLAGELGNLTRALAARLESAGMG